MTDYKQTAPIGIGRGRDRAAERAAEVAVIRAVRSYIWATRHACQACHGRRRAECHGRPDEMHEDPPRSATRGLPPEQRFNLIVCARLCYRCHRDVTEHRIRLETDPTLGFLGPVTVVAVV